MLKVLPGLAPPILSLDARSFRGASSHPSSLEREASCSARWVQGDMLIRSHRFVALATLLAATPAAAQVVQTPAQELSTVSAAAPTASPTTVKWTLRLAPTVSGNLPWEEGDRLSDYQTTSAGIAIRSKFGDLGKAGVLSLGLDGGLQFGTDFDNDSTEETASAIVGNATVTWERGFRRLSPFVSYGYEAGFNKVLSDHAQTDHVLGVGFTLTMFRVDRCLKNEDPRVSGTDCTGKAKRHFLIKPSLERTLSSDAARERITPKLGIDWAGKFFDERLGWRLRGVGELRRFDKVEGFRRRDDRLTLSGALDLANFLKSPAVDELSIGVRWIRNESNVAGKDLSRASFVPSLTLTGEF